MDINFIEKKYTVIFVTIIMFSASVFAGEKNEEEYVSDFSRIMSISHSDASSFLSYIADMTESIGDDLGTIASKSAEDSKKDTAIYNILKYFGNPSYICTSSLNRKRKKCYYSHIYLNRLKNLKYEKVELYFDLDDLRLGDISKIRSPNGMDGFTFNVKIWQYFKGCTKNEVCYQDWAQKSFGVVVYKKKGAEHLDIRTFRIKSTKASKAHKQRAVFR